MIQSTRLIPGYTSLPSLTLTKIYLTNNNILNIDDRYCTFIYCNINAYFIEIKK